MLFNNKKSQSFGLRVLPEVWAQRRKSFPNEPLKVRNKRLVYMK